ncbi:hypothetical protein BGZ95_011901 [Linnemannia exigua]|uniref:FAD-binding domain-containing protein n=1 Tax=Linnemannia exigua TaxID=604196 RepID=A0AAD4H5B3_9FUNG|nr:hypothetical protein BGZ95_011901 [Linnemannia exigua]
MTSSPQHTLSSPTTAIAAATTDRPRVLIVGAGLAGLTLAILLEKAGVPYDIFERGLEARTVGSAIFMEPSIGPLFTQIGIYDEFLEKSKPCEATNVYNENRDLQFIIDYKLATEMGGYASRIIPRTTLYKILLDKVPDGRIHKRKKMVSLYQDDNIVKIYFADGSNCEGDIVVGADGAYSAVRHCLYESLDQDGRLLPSDAEDLPYSCICLAGHSGPLDVDKFPSLKDGLCRYDNTHSSEKPYSWMTFTNKDNVICWGVFKYLDTQNSAAYSREQRSDWGEGATETMCNEVRDFFIPGGDGTLTMGDLIDGTPLCQMTKVMLEEKVFDTWHHGRTVLVGDVTLANWINVLSSSSTIQDLEKAFRTYKEERFPLVREAAVHSKNMTQVSSTTLRSEMSRYVTEHMPQWLWRLVYAKKVAYRPQASFLPFVKDNGSVSPASQRSYKETLKILEIRRSSAVTAVAAAV